MSLIHRRLFTTAALVLIPLLPMAAVRAQEEKPAETRPAEGKVDPEAKKAIDEMVMAHKALKSFSAKTIFKAEQGDRKQNITGTIEFSSPNKVRTTGNADGVVTRTAVSDGKQMFIMSSDNEKTYEKRPAAPDFRNVAQAMIASGNGGSGLLILLLTSPNAQNEVLGQVKSLEFGPDENYEGVEARVVKAVLATPPNPEVTFVIGKADSLLRRVSLAATVQNQKLSLSDSYSDVKVNPEIPEATFAFTPPPGATEVKPVAENEEQMYDPRLKVGAKPLPFSGVDTTGKPVNLESYKGKVVLVDFWATWCGPCVAEIPNIVAVYNKYKAQGFDVIGVSLDNANAKAKLAAFTKENKMPWRQIYDGKGWGSALATAYGVRAIPFTMLIGRDGKIAALELRGKNLETAVKTALAKK